MSILLKKHEGKESLLLIPTQLKSKDINYFTRAELLVAKYPVGVEPTERNITNHKTCKEITKFVC